MGKAGGSWSYCAYDHKGESNQEGRQDYIKGQPLVTAYNKVTFAKGLTTLPNSATSWGHVFQAHDCIRGILHSSHILT